MAKVNELQSETAWKKSVERRRHNIQREQESYGIPPNELRLVIIGKSGNGKSSTANTIIGTNHFKTAASATSITKNTEEYRASRFGKKILLVDTPGLFDPEIGIKETNEEISRCICMTLPGFHAFLLVVRAGARFTPEEMNTVKEFEKLFGEKLYDFMIIVFTRMDDLVREHTTLEDFVSGHPNLKQLMERCNRRYVGLNNIDSPENKQKATKYLVEMIETMIDSKDPNHYTNEAFEKAEKDLRVTIKAEKERKKAAKRAEFEEMFAEKEKKMTKEHDTQMKEMKDFWDKKIKQQEENAKRRLTEEKATMEAYFNAETKAMLEKETKVRDALANQHREDSEKARKEITDKFEKEIEGIKDDNAKKEKLANELKVRLELEKKNTDKFYESIAKKQEEVNAMVITSMADHKERISEQAKRFDNERKSTQNEHEKETKKMTKLHNRLLKKEKKLQKTNHKLLIAEEARKEAVREQSVWYRIGRRAGWIKTQ